MLERVTPLIVGNPFNFFELIDIDYLHGVRYVLVVKTGEKRVCLRVFLGGKVRKTHIEIHVKVIEVCGFKNLIRIHF